MKKALSSMLLALAVSACVSMPATHDEPAASAPSGAGASASATMPEREPARPSGPSATLLEQSRAHAAAGGYDQAAASLERAIRIDPGDPWLWLELAKVHFASGNVPQAESHARKALSLSGHDAAARDAAEKLLDTIAAR